MGPANVAPAAETDGSTIAFGNVAEAPVMAPYTSLTETPKVAPAGASPYVCDPNTSKPPFGSAWT